MWQDIAACSGMDTGIFFSSDNPGKETWITGEPDRVSLAKGICSRCPVRGECRDFAIGNNDQWGIYGGLTARERRRRAA